MFWNYLSIGLDAEVSQGLEPHLCSVTVAALATQGVAGATQGAAGRGGCNPAPAARIVCMTAPRPGLPVPLLHRARPPTAARPPSPRRRPRTASTRCGRATRGLPPTGWPTRPGTRGIPAPRAGSAARRWAIFLSCGLLCGLGWGISAAPELPDCTPGWLLLGGIAPPPHAWACMRAQPACLHPLSAISPSPTRCGCGCGMSRAASGGRWRCRAACGRWCC